jgi:type II secretory pathway component HofQ
LKLKRSLTEVAVDTQALDEGPVHMPNFIEIESDEEERGVFREIAKKNGSRIKKYKKEKSLGILCQQFIHLFVTWADVISLEGAAYRISLSEKDEADRKNKKATAN